MFLSHKTKTKQTHFDFLKRPTAYSYFLILTLSNLYGCIQSPATLESLSGISTSNERSTSDNRGEESSSEGGSENLSDSNHSSGHSSGQSSPDNSSTPSTSDRTSNESQDSSPGISLSNSSPSALDLKQICQPQPHFVNPYTHFAKDLRDWVEEHQDSSCTLIPSQFNERSHHLLHTQPTFGQRGEEQCDDEGCWDTLSSFTKQWQESLDVDQDLFVSKSLWVGVVDMRRHQESGVLEAVLYGAQTHSSALHQITKRWDAEGNLLFEGYRFNHALWFEMEYQWQDGQLIQIETSDFINQTRGRLIEFSYTDQGHLSSAQVLDKLTQTQYTSTWEYTEEGQPSTLTRSLTPSSAQAESQVWFKIQWNYHENTQENQQHMIQENTQRNGALDSRTVWVDLDLLSSIQLRKLADSHSLSIIQNQSHWDRMSLKWNKHQSCVQLPTGIEYGYPSHLNAYHLGWDEHFRPEHIDIAHGYQRVYRRGDLGWFGHFGPQGEEYSPTVYTAHALHRNILNNEASSEHEVKRTLKLNTQYQDLIPLTETGWTSPLSLDDLMTQGHLLSVHEPDQHDSWNHHSQRIWRWNDGFLVEDALSVDGLEPLLLAWKRNAQGAPTERTLTQTYALVARHEWTYRPHFQNLPKMCQIARYTLKYSLRDVHQLGENAIHFSQHTGFPDEYVFGHDESLFDTFYQYDFTSSTLEHDQGCREIQIQGTDSTSIQIQFDENERIIQSQGDRFARNHFGFNHRKIHYHPSSSSDSPSSLISKIERINSAEHTFQTVEEYTFNDRGQLESRFTSVNGQNQYQEFDYICEN